MSDEELKGLLLAGEDIEYFGFMVRNYKLGEIFKNLKLDKYNYLLSFAVLDVKDIFKDSKINIDKLKKYDVICDIPEFNNWFIEFLNTFTYLEWEKGIENGKYRDFVAYTDNDKNKKRFRINEDKFDGFMELFKKMYAANKGKKSKSKFDPNMAIDEETRKIVEELAEAERKHKEKRKKGNKDITLMGIILGICSKSNNYDLFNIWNLTIYQLMAQYYGIEQDENYGYILESVYHGVYDLKKSGTNLEDIHWANEISV